MTTVPCPPEGGVLIAIDGATARLLLEALAAAVAAAEAGSRSRPLTPREREVLLCLSEGKGYGQIAAELVIELETVRTHARRVRRKLGVATSRELHGRVAKEEAGCEADHEPRPSLGGRPAPEGNGSGAGSRPAVRADRARASPADITP